MKWNKLKEYIEETIDYGEGIKQPSDQENGFLYGLQDVFDRMMDLENEERVKSSDQYWIPEQDENNENSSVTIGKEYKVLWDDRDKEEVIIDDNDTMSLIFMCHNGSFVEKPKTF